MENERAQHTGADDALRCVKATRLSLIREKRNGETVSIATERVLTIDIAGVGLYSLMCTPADSRALAVGFAFTEGLIRGLDDISVLAECPDAPDVIRMKITGILPNQVSSAHPLPPRGRIVASSCGMCGTGKTLQEIIGELPVVPVTMEISAALLRDMGVRMHKHQRLFRQTGGTHAAALFDRSGNIVSFAEDIGRHNTVDKVVGRCLLTGKSPRGLGIFLSGRASLEIVTKCIRAGVEILAAVSAPTSLAVEVAERSGLTLCAFVREDRATVFTGGERIGAL